MLWIDATELAAPHRTGIERTIEELAHALAGAGQATSFVARGDELLHADARPLAARLLRRGPAPATFASGDLVLLPGLLWVRPEAHDMVAARARQAGAQVATIIYDLTPLRMPHCFPPGVEQAFEAYLVRAATTSDQLLAISRHTEGDLRSWALARGLDLPPVHVFRLGDGFTEPRRRVAKPSSAMPQEPYVLCVGTLEARKNPMCLYLAWRWGLANGHPMPRLVLAGRRGFGADDALRALEGDPLVRTHVEVREGTSDDDLERLYQDAAMTVYPSLYEGWGLPVAESLRRGKVTLASSASSMPEVGGDLADYFDPHDPVALARLVLAYTDRARRARREREVSAGFVPTPWASAARDLLAACGIPRP